MKIRKLLCVFLAMALIMTGGSALTDFTPQIMSLTVSAAEKLAAPENVTISVTGSSAVLKWDKVKGADAYRVYKYDSTSRKFVRIKTVSGNKAVISNLSAGTHYFKVAAAVKSGKSYVSGTASPKVKASVKASTVKNTEKSDKKAASAASDNSVTETASVKLAKAMGNGWNLGNTMESVGDWINSVNAADYEKAWGQPITTKAMITNLKKEGFSSVRIPVAWSNMMSSDGKYTISQSYFDRIDEIVGYVLDNDMYCIINIHWDGGWWEDFGSSDSKVSDAAMTKYKSMWTQIAKHYAGYSDKLIFESANEELGSATRGKSSLADSYERVNAINQTFVDIVRATGSKNASRFLLIAGYDTDIAKTANSKFKMPTDTIDGHLLVSVHYYTPSTFCIADNSNNSWGYMDSWGTEEDISAMEKELAKMKKFTDAGYGVIIGEYGVCKKANTKQVKKGTFDFFSNMVRISEKYGYCPMLWDCSDWYIRSDGSFKYPELDDIY